MANSKCWIVVTFLVLTSLQCSTNHYVSQLKQEGLPDELYQRRHQFESLKIHHPLTDLSWIRDAKKLQYLEVDSSNIMRLGPLPKTLRKVHLKNGRVAHVAGGEDLSSLTLEGNQRDLNFDALEGRNIQSLILHSCDPIVSPWPKMPELTHMEIIDTEFKHELDLTQWPTLTTLHLQTKSKIVNLRKASALSTLSIIGSTPGPLPRGIKHLTLNQVPGKPPIPTGLFSLKIAHMAAFRLDQLPKMETLERLELEGYMDIPSFATLVEKAPNLRHLLLRDMPIKHLEGVHELEIDSLTLDGLDALLDSPDQTNGFSLVGDSTDLKALYLLDTQLSAEQYAVVSELTTLQTLHIKSASIATLDLSSLTQLSALTLENSNVHAIEGLENCTELTAITLRDCNSLTQFSSYEAFPTVKELRWEGQGCLASGLCDGRGELRWTIEEGQEPSLKEAHITPIPGFSPIKKPEYKHFVQLTQNQDLQSFTLRRANVKDLTQLSAATRLKQVALENVDIQSLEGLPKSVISLSLVGQSDSPFP